MTEISEGKYKFTFPDEWKIALKFDEERDYKNLADSVKETKGVDIVALSTKRKQLLFIELKDFENYEQDPNTKERLKNGAENLSTEIAQKVRDTLSCMLAAARNSTNKADVWNNLCAFITNRNSDVKVIAWTNEPFDQNNYEEQQWKVRQTTRNHKLKNKLKWLTTKVLYLNERDNTLINLGITITKN